MGLSAWERKQSRHSLTLSRQHGPETSSHGGFLREGRGLLPARLLCRPYRKEVFILFVSLDQMVALCTVLRKSLMLDMNSAGKSARGSISDVCHTCRADVTSGGLRGAGLACAPALDRRSQTSRWKGMRDLAGHTLSCCGGDNGGSGRRGDLQINGRTGLEPPPAGLFPGHCCASSLLAGRPPGSGEDLGLGHRAGVLQATCAGWPRRPGAGGAVERGVGAPRAPVSTRLATPSRVTLGRSHCLANLVHKW